MWLLFIQFTVQSSKQELYYNLHLEVDPKIQEGSYKSQFQ